jgi:5-methylcytosine-specific restriction endonuclease McrA
VAKRTNWVPKCRSRVIENKKRGPKVQRKKKWELAVDKRISRRKLLIERDGGKCGYCFTKKGSMTIDHIVPLAKGGADKLYNMMLACWDCNQEKADMAIEDWLKKIGWDDNFHGDEG